MPPSISPRPASPAHRLARAVGPTFAALRHRNFRLFFIGQTISNTGNWLTRVALILLVLKITGNGVAVGLVTACEFAPVLLLSAWGGAIADRSDKRKLLFVTQALEMVQSVAVAVLAFMPHPPLLGLYALTVIGGSLLAFDNPLRRAFVTEMVPDKDIPNAVVLYSTIVNLSRVFGPALAGLLVGTVGFGWSFMLDATSYGAVLLCLGLMRTSELLRGALRPRARGEILEGLRYVASQPRLWISLSMFVAIGIFTYNFTVTLPLFVKDVLSGSTSAFTLLYAIFGMGSVIGALAVARRQLVGMGSILLGALALGVSTLALAVTAAFWTAAVMVFLLGLASILYTTSTTAIIQVEGRRDMHGRLLALQTVVMGGTSVIGGPLLGGVADMLGGRAPLVLGGAASLTTALVGYIVSRTSGARGSSMRRST